LKLLVNNGAYLSPITNNQIGLDIKGECRNETADNGTKALPAECCSRDGGGDSGRYEYGFIWRAGIDKDRRTVSWSDSESKTRPTGQ
jgi:hypothetical protein